MRFRTMLARFYAASDRKRGKYEAMQSPEWTILSRLPENSAASMSTVSEESIALEQFRREDPPPVKKDLSEDPQKREWKNRARTDGKAGTRSRRLYEFSKGILVEAFCFRESYLSLCRTLKILRWRNGSLAM